MGIPRTPQSYEEEIASLKQQLASQPSAAWTCNDIDDTNCKSEKLEQFCRDNIRLAPFFAMLANKLSTPDSSVDVLVEALRKITDYPSNCAPGMSIRQIAQKALDDYYLL